MQSLLHRADRPKRSRRRVARGATGSLLRIACLLGIVAGLLPAPADAGVDRILVEKSQRRLSLIRHGVAFRTYRVALGADPEAPKEEEGDERTPEGRYVIDYRKPDSTFHRALHISYPNDRDRERAEARGVSPGGAIMIHGLPRDWSWLGAQHRARDWTDGCIAVTNEEIEEIWSWVEVGTPIEILP